MNERLEKLVKSYRDKSAKDYFYNMIKIKDRNIKEDEDEILRLETKRCFEVSTMIVENIENQIDVLIDILEISKQRGVSGVRSIIRSHILDSLQLSITKLNNINDNQDEE